MLELVKCDIRGRKNKIVLMSALLVISHILMLLTFQWSSAVEKGSGLSFMMDGSLNKLSVFSLVLAISLSGISLLIAVIHGIKSLVVELVGNQGKLSFSIPEQSSKIIYIKLIATSIEYITYFIIICIFCVLHIGKGVASTQGWQSVVYMLDDLVYTILIAAITYISFMTLVYFSMILAKGVFKVKSGFAVISIIFIVVIGSIIDKLETLIEKAAPVYIELQSLRIGNVATASITEFSVVKLVIDLICIIVFLRLSSYIVDKKLSLE
ncbi:hypothetical protein [Cellulosilyticum ruminicola]|uniref:hypothetical protein n=1 Tax=Cellulosilyticum ruminicola TaxID=425254 RepID=UPI0006CFC0BE|nr:hypothetical protein [Cellulosilyticum ruminicola]